MNSYYMRRAIAEIAPALLEGIPEDDHTIHTFHVEEDNGGLGVVIGYATQEPFDMYERRAVVDGGRVVTDYTVLA